MAKKADKEIPERWRDIPGFCGRYQASTAGQIRKVYTKRGRTVTRLIAAFTKKRHRHSANRKTLMVHLSLPDGRRVERQVHRLIADTWLGGVPDGMNVVHGNGLHSDNTVENLVYMTTQRLGEKYGGTATRRPVVKVDRSGVAVEYYRSAREAGRRDHLCYQSVMDRCNGKVKNEYSLTGYTYRWDDKERAMTYQ